MDVRIVGPAWAWGRNREMQKPAVVSVTHMPGNEPTVWLSVYSNRGFERGSSPIDLHLSPEDAYAVGKALIEQAVAGLARIKRKLPVCYKCGRAIRKSEYLDFGGKDNQRHIVCPAPR